MQENESKLIELIRDGIRHAGKGRIVDHSGKKYNQIS